MKESLKEKKLEKEHRIKFKIEFIYSNKNHSINKIKIVKRLFEYIKKNNFFFI